MYKELQHFYYQFLFLGIKPILKAAEKSRRILLLGLVLILRRSASYIQLLHVLPPLNCVLFSARAYNSGNRAVCCGNFILSLLFTHINFQC